MKLEIYAFYDRKSQELINPVFMRNEEVLKRDLIKMYGEKPKNIPFIEYPQDFDVYKVGEFDTNAVDNKNEVLFKADYRFNVADIMKDKIEESM